MSSDLSGKTVRPGSLNSYSYYHSSRSNRTATATGNSSQKTRRGRYFLAGLAVIVLGFWLGFGGEQQSGNKANQTQPPTKTKSVPAISSTSSKASGQTNDACSGNQLPKFIKVSISGRRLWACEADKDVYSVAIITGLRNHPETETPAGTYSIYAKQTNTTLTGSDSRGSWNDPVYYWMPFLDNQYGTYGFHDATWRSNSAFGQVSPDSKDASHGCIELPLASSKWLYNWAEIGTTVSVQN